jgi:rhodanese-related sulfurtransferase
MPQPDVRSIRPTRGAVLGSLRNPSEERRAVSEIVIVSPEEAQGLIAKGDLYVDVRSEPEYEEGHPPGAYNVPWQHKANAGLVPNPDFLGVMAKAFPKDAPLVIGCRSGGRSQKAAAALLEAGYTNVREMRAGWDANRDAFGRVTPGWSRKGLPVEPGAPEGRRYEDLKKKGPA